jgi:hypothetical protein
VHESSGAVPLLCVEAGQGAVDNFFVAVLEYILKVE